MSWFLPHLCYTDHCHTVTIFTAIYPDLLNLDALYHFLLLTDAATRLHVSSHCTLAHIVTTFKHRHASQENTPEIPQDRKTQVRILSKGLGMSLLFFFPYHLGPLCWFSAGRNFLGVIRIWSTCYLSKNRRLTFSPSPKRHFFFSSLRKQQPFYFPQTLHLQLALKSKHFQLNISVFCLFFFWFPKKLIYFPYHESLSWPVGQLNSSVH